MKEMICICCPLGCHLQVSEIDGIISVKGNTCKRGENYGKDELTCPKRMVTSVVRVEGEDLRMASVKTDKPIEKKLIFSCLKEIKKVKILKPCMIGDIVIKNVCGTDVNVVVTKNII